ncbi:iron-siderophore ABC transporter substrate-binding protein [Nocardioides lianchengensis]|uniref:Iron complex transport system substrate-binding protein n=1 Tax=Nocardioides lianchengensis TaxID=1045774 RepID=A0A1G7A1I3_9ACTN|nr:iron-siderophore ABC transporter substrate-binding protein [Nocardioides lianchengensis]NYG12317.1 iron complex transport system substrate-binding protein [Nocardioides lianchengensis]SDE08611.1 iron complex transport system substrate-binding protein [Nocardioides lianchengensis]
MRSTRFLAAATATALALTLGACGSDDDSEASDAGGSEGGSSSAAAFPVTIEHVYGETTIEEKPERVATVAWANHEVPLALGVVPVGMSKATWGDDDNDGVLPWVEEKLEELDAETPVLFDETEGIDFEAVADTQPDVILASYSGITQEEYDTLSKIAPVVAYPDVAWSTSVEDMTLMNSKALGLETEGEELVADLQARVSESFAAHPGLADKSAMFAYIDPKDLSTVGFYTTHDTRPGFLAASGMVTPAVVEEASSESDEFYVTRSAENPEDFADVDVFITYGDPAGGDIVKMIQADPLLSKIPAVKAGAIAIFEDSTPLAASANPSPLSIMWGIDEYFDVIEAAAEKA